MLTRSDVTDRIVQRQTSDPADAVVRYVPRLGRFLQVDPVEGGGANDCASGVGSGFRSWAVSAHQRAWGVRLSRRMQWGMNLGPQSVATTCASIRRARC
jgi:hypothetical protein